LNEIDLVVPKLGMDTTEAIVANWLIQEGDSVKKGMPVVELETEKVSFAVESEVDGKLTRILHPAGATVPVGGILATIAMA
jgi:pyruvate/2-oxoglutarate dehydrogenase complex dihydrolipoamide acyltransferase (E2) component